MNNDIDWDKVNWLKYNIPSLDNARAVLLLRCVGWQVGFASQLFYRIHHANIREGRGRGFVMVDTILQVLRAEVQRISGSGVGQPIEIVLQQMLWWLNGEGSLRGRLRLAVGVLERALPKIMPLLLGTGLWDSLYDIYGVMSIRGDDNQVLMVNRQGRSVRATP